jgi:endonuclease/exonuclease/phosphatase family metal-dependent hydrolase
VTPEPAAGRTARLLAVSGGVWLLVDLWRVWTPSLITIFGQAASTPPEAIGGFAVGVMVVPLVLLLLLGRRLTAPAVLHALLLLAVVARVALMLLDGGRPQLAVASFGVVAAVLWLCLAADCLGDVLVPGLFLGILLSASTHAALGSFGAVWRHDPWGWLLLAAQVLLVLAAWRGHVPVEARAVARRTAWLVFPALLLAGIALADVGRASTVDSTWGPVVLVAGCAIGFGVAALVAVPRWAAALGLVLLVGAVVVAMLVTGREHGITGSLPLWSLVAYGVGMPGLALCLGRHGATAPTSARPALAAAGGAVVWVLVLFGYYAGYDLGYRADWLVVAVAVVVGVVPLLLGAPRPVRPVLRRPVLLGGATVALLLAGFGPMATLRPLDGGPGEAANGPLRVLAWNLRMGYGLDGRFDAEGAARLIRAEHPDVVLLSEVDRGWLLNGGQDQLHILARLLDMHAVFGPAADPVWGDAILTRGPVYRLHRQELEADGSLTGAEALSLKVPYDGVRVAIVATHLQPRDDELNQTLGQVQELATRLGAASDAGPVVLGGDLNTTPGSTAWRALLVTGFEDLLAGARPLPTDPAGHPVHQIDHVIGSPGMRGSHAHAPRTMLSDHLPVVVDLRLPRGVGQRGR